MNCTLREALLSLVLAVLPGVGFAQLPLQRGVGVQLPVTSNAVVVQNANDQDALVVALTADGNTYLGVSPLPTSALAESVKSILLAAFAVGGFTVAFGRMWEGFVEMVRLGNDHLSYRGQRGQWIQLAPTLFVWSTVSFSVVAFGVGWWKARKQKAAV